jgi:hypothetical protein
VDIEIKATLSIVGKLHVCKSARLKKCKYEIEKIHVYKIEL